MHDRWLYSAASGEVVTVGRNPQRVAVIATDGDDDTEADQIGETVALAPRLLAFARVVAEQSCPESSEPGGECGDCLVCIAHELVDEVSS